VNSVTAIVVKSATCNIISQVLINSFEIIENWSIKNESSDRHRIKKTLFTSEKFTVYSN
jgi:hypothetical protein